MPTYIALLRGINVGGNKMVSMADLRALTESLGFTNVRTLLQSGNLLLDASGGRRSPAALEKQLEAETLKRFKIEVSYLVRTPADLAAVIQANPFPREAAADPSHLLVMFLKSPPAPACIKDLAAVVKPPEKLHVIGNHAYISYGAGVGTSKLTGAVIEKKLACRGSARNWNTVLKLAALAPA
jgi:uncharacterized protein (DUF1697 family)